MIPKHIYIGEQPHVAQILVDNSIKHEKSATSYLNRLRPPNARTTKLSIIPTPKHLSLPQQKTINKNKLSFSLKMSELNWKQALSLIKLHPLNVLCYNYNSCKNNYRRAKKILSEKNSEFLSKKVRASNNKHRN